MTIVQQRADIVPLRPETVVRRVKTRGIWHEAFRRFMRVRLSVLGLVLTGLFVFFGVFGPFLAPHDYLSQDLSRVAQAPSWDYPFGTDNVGRDLLSRMLWGARTAVSVTVVVITLCLILGAVIGGVAGYLGGYVDMFLTWVTDLVMTVPALLLAVLVNYTVKQPLSDLTEALYQRTGWEMFSTGIYSGYLVVLASLAFVFWPHYARLIRGQVLLIREQDYVLAARALGVSDRRLMLHYLIPNALGPVLVVAALGAADIIVLEASLSYLGVGIQPPGASWGSMISSNLDQWGSRAHLVIVPAAVLGLAALGIAFLGNGLSDALDPRRGPGPKR
jgi:peptide/nickel transport system permease protein